MTAAGATRRSPGSQAKKAARPGEPYRFLGPQLRRMLENAVEVAEPRGREICGLIVDNGLLLELLPLKNKATAPGSFHLPRKKVQRARRAARRIGHRVVGTFHSHPVSPAVPGESDLTGAEKGELMLIFSCFDAHARLWRLRKRSARELPFSTIEL